MNSREDWARALARQANADLQLLKYLSLSTDVPVSERLHALQMACEKAAKAHVYRSKAPIPQDIATSHAYAQKHLPDILRHLFIHDASKRKSAWLIREFRRLAREVDLLAPSVSDGGRRNDNCEYPWLDARGVVVSPLDYSFPSIDLARDPAAAEFLKYLGKAIAEMLPQ